MIPAVVDGEDWCQASDKADENSTEGCRVVVVVVVGFTHWGTPAPLSAGQ